MIILVMGVSASGKTTVAKRFAKSLSWEFGDVDDLHPRENIEKMELINGFWILIESKLITYSPSYSNKDVAVQRL